MRYGIFHYTAAQLIGDQGCLVAMDPLPDYIERVSQKVQAADLKNVRVVKCDALDTRLASALSECRHTTIVVSHLAYGHLADRYGLDQVGLSGLASGFEASPRAITDAVDLIKELGLEYVLQEPISESRLAETVARETGATILELHPLESLTPAQRDAGEDFFSVMDRNIAVLVKALDCDR